MSFIKILRKLIKSKTLDFNVLVGAVFTILRGCGVEVSADVMTSVLVIGNMGLRCVSKGSLKDK